MDPLLIAFILYLLALLLCFIDIFIPSGGMLLILGSVSAIAAVLFGFRSSLNGGLGVLTLVLVSIPVFAFFAFKIWPHTPLGKRILLHPPQAASSELHDELQKLVGVVTIAESPLMPTGHLKIGHRHYNAVAESGSVDVGQRVKVFAVRERMLHVRITSEAISIPDSLQLGNPPTTEATNRTATEEANLLERPATELGLNSLEELPLDRDD